MDPQSEENGSAEQRKTKREKNNNGRTHRRSEHQSSNSRDGCLRSADTGNRSDNAKSLKGQSKGSQKKSERNYNRKRMELTNTNKKDDAIFPTHSKASKLRKHKNVERNRREINK